MFHFMFVHYTFSSVWVAEWPPFGELPPTRLAICSHCILSICNIYLFPVLVFRAGFSRLIAPVPVHCFSITSITNITVEQIIDRTSVKSSVAKTILCLHQTHYWRQVIGRVPRHATRLKATVYV